MKNLPTKDGYYWINFARMKKIIVQVIGTKKEKNRAQVYMPGLEDPFFADDNNITWLKGQIKFKKE